MSDIGGRRRAPDNRDIYEEGLQIPILKLYEAGQLNATLMEIIRRNVRVPAEVAGDIHAMVGAAERMAQGVSRLVTEYGLADLPCTPIRPDEFSYRFFLSLHKASLSSNKQDAPPPVLPLPIIGEPHGSTQRAQIRVIVDAHVHTFPPLDGASGYASAQQHAMMLQNKVAGYWGRMGTNTLDEACKPLPGEDVGFRIGKYGRYYWTKGGRECWMQRFPLAMDNMEWPPERMIAYMDAVGVDVGVLQSGYMEMNFARDYFAKCVEGWPDRFVSTVAVDFDARRDAKYRENELAKLRYAVAEQHAKGVFQGFPKGQPFDDELFDPFWRTLIELRMPHIFLTGWEPKAPFLASIQRLENVQRKFPDLQMVLGHLGGNVLPPSDPNHTDTVKVLRNVLRGSNVYFEAGYVMAFENKEAWGADYEYPYPQHTRLLTEVYEEVGASRMIWGSDEPNNERACTYLQCLETVRTHCTFLNEDEKKQVLGLNAARLYRIPIRQAATS